MTTTLAIDLFLGLVVLGIAVFTLGTRSVYSATVAFVGYGVVVSLVWVRLAAPDIALTEAAIGGGLTSVLLLTAAARLRAFERTPEAPPSLALRVVAAVLSLLVASGLALAVVTLPDPAPSLAAQARDNAPAVGVGNAVTATLMAFRGTDTFLEKVVLVLALIGVWSLARDDDWGGRPGARHQADPRGPLAFFARLLPPVGLVIGTYLLWTSADHPGGAFQGGTALAAMWLLAIMARLADTPAIAGRVLRLGVVIGPALFLVVGLAGAGFGDGFLAYPPEFAKPIILLIEIPMTLTIALVLTLLMAGAPERVGGAAAEDGGKEPSR